MGVAGAGGRGCPSVLSVAPGGLNQPEDVVIGGVSPTLITGGQDETASLRRSVDRHYLIRNILLRPWDLAGDFENCRSVGDVLGDFTKGIRVSLNKLLGK